MRSLQLLIATYIWIIILRAVVSWLQPQPRHLLVRWLHKVTEPVLFPLRLLVPPRLLGGLDVSPVLAILLLQYGLSALQRWL